MAMMPTGIDDSNAEKGITTRKGDMLGGRFIQHRVLAHGLLPGINRVKCCSQERRSTIVLAAGGVPLTVSGRTSQG